MVKGNWERRAELAAQRRAEEKARKASKGTKQKMTNVESVVARLTQRFFPGEVELHVIEAWLRLEWEEEGDGSDMCCSAFFRTRLCAQRKCKFAHPPLEILLARLLNVPFDESKDEGKQEEACCLPVPLSAVSRRDIVAGKVLFLAVDSALVYDHKNGNVWDEWAEQKEKSMSLRESGAGGVILEGDEGEEDEEEGDGKDQGLVGDHFRKSAEREEDGNTGGGLKEASSSSSNSHFCVLADAQRGFLHHHPLLFGHCLSFLSEFDVFITLCSSAKVLKKVIFANDRCREMRKAALALFASRLKSEKKKKKKNAFIKSQDKVDAFARGAPR